MAEYDSTTVLEYWSTTHTHTHTHILEYYSTNMNE